MAAASLACARFATMVQAKQVLVANTAMHFWQDIVKAVVNGEVGARYGAAYAIESFDCKPVVGDAEVGKRVATHLFVDGFVLFGQDRNH